jgi:uncharacterized protein (TIGR03086 family)
VADTPALDILDRALQQAVRVVTAVQPDQLESPTPCSEWTVRDLLHHMVGGLQNFRRVVEGEPITSFDVEVADADLAASYRDDASDLMAAWRVEGALDRRLTMFGGEVPASMPLHLQITETALHSWDLARSTEHPGSLDPEVAERALAFTTANMGPQTRGRSFAPERDAPPGAGPYERLAAFSGREAGA